MNVLMILPWLNYPFRYGGDQALFNSIKAVKDDVNLSILVLTGHRGFSKDKLLRIERVLENVNIVVYSEKSSRKWGLYAFDKLCEKIKKFLFGKKEDYFVQGWSRVYDVKTDAFNVFLNNVIRERSIDVVQIEMIPAISSVLSVPDGVKKVFVHHELRFVIRNHFIRQHKDNLYWKTLWEYNKILEIGFLNKFDAIVTLSKCDAEKLKNAGVYKSIYASKAIVDTAINDNVVSDRSTILSFVGPEKQMPNRVGLQWFLENCWGELLHVNKNYRLWVVGEWSEKTKKDYEEKYPNVHFWGFVDNLTERIDNTIMIVPITIGSGIRMKILEAAAIGIPVVTTSIGVEGIPYTDGKECFICDAPNKFVKAIVALNSEELRYSLINNSRQILIQNYSFESFRKDRMNLYNKLLKT